MNLPYTTTLNTFQPNNFDIARLHQSPQEGGVRYSNYYLGAVVGESPTARSLNNKISYANAVRESFGEARIAQAGKFLGQVEDGLNLPEPQITVSEDIETAPLLFPEDVRYKVEFIETEYLRLPPSAKEAKAKYLTNGRLIDVDKKVARLTLSHKAAKSQVRIQANVRELEIKTHEKEDELPNFTIVLNRNKYEGKQLKLVIEARSREEVEDKFQYLKASFTTGSDSLQENSVLYYRDLVTHEKHPIWRVGAAVPNPHSEQTSISISNFSSSDTLETSASTPEAAILESSSGGGEAEEPDVADEPDVAERQTLKSLQSDANHQIEGEKLANYVLKKAFKELELEQSTAERLPVFQEEVLTLNNDNREDFSSFVFGKNLIGGFQYVQTEGVPFVDNLELNANTNLPLLFIDNNGDSETESEKSLHFSGEFPRTATPLFFSESDTEKNNQSLRATTSSNLDQEEPQTPVHTIISKADEEQETTQLVSRAINEALLVWTDDRINSLTRTQVLDKLNQKNRDDKSSSASSVSSVTTAARLSVISGKSSSVSSVPTSARLSVPNSSVSNVSSDVANLGDFEEPINNQRPNNTSLPTENRSGSRSNSSSQSNSRSNSTSQGGVVQKRHKHSRFRTILNFVGAEASRLKRLIVQ